MNTQEGIDFLLNQKKDINWIIEKKGTKKALLHTQRKMFRGLFKEISNHLGEDPEQVKQNFLKGCFGIKEVKTGKLTFENAVKPTTSELLKEEAIFFINMILKFIEKYGVPCKYTSKQIQSLYDSYIK